MSAPEYPLWKRWLVSLFLVLNLSAVAYANRPEWLKNTIHGWGTNNLTPQNYYRLRKGAWYLSYYAHLIGLDNRWQMFGRQSRFNWWYIVRGEYANEHASELKLLPIPQQTTRTLLQRLVFDLKENKILLNMYNKPFGRECYSRYLARQNPSMNGMPIRAVHWELAHQKIVAPDEAIKLRKLRYDQVYVRNLNQFELPPQNAPHTLATLGEQE